MSPLRIRHLSQLPLYGRLALLVGFACTALIGCAQSHKVQGHANTSNAGSPAGAVNALRTTPTAKTSIQPAAPSSVGAMPASSSALVVYVRGARSVNSTEYQQAEPGPGRAMRPTPGIAEFNTPSGNITCAIVGNTQPGDIADVMCTAQQSSFRIPPKPASCHNDWAGYFGFVARKEVSVGACVGGPEFEPTTLDLPYGSDIQLSGIGCRSESSFLACADLTTGHGFAVNRDVLKTY